MMRYNKKCEEFSICCEVGQAGVIVLEKSTEIGINEITPILCEHSERKVLKLERMNKILVTAMKQSKQAYLPKLNAAISFDSFVSNNTR